MVAVAEELEENGTIGQDHVAKAFTSVALRRAGIHPVEVTVEKPDGTSAVHETKSVGNTVMIPQVWYVLDAQKKDVTPTAGELPQS